MQLPTGECAPDIQQVDRRTTQREINVLFVGSRLSAAKKVFRRENDPVKCEHANTAEEALGVMMARVHSTPFDCVMIDMREENELSPLNVVAISALYAANRVIVLASLDKVDTFSSLTGVDLVLPAPVDPKIIIKTILNSPSPAVAKGSSEPTNDPPGHVGHSVTLNSDVEQHFCNTESAVGSLTRDVDSAKLDQTARVPAEHMKPPKNPDPVTVKRPPANSKVSGTTNRSTLTPDALLELQAIVAKGRRESVQRPR